jgi:hypothetical protein
VFATKKEYNFNDFMDLNKNKSSELFCVVMALLYKDLPCTKTIHRLRKKFLESTSAMSSGSRSPTLASPRLMPGVANFVENRSV